MDYLNDFLKQASHRVSHLFQEDFLISREEKLRIKDQRQEVLKSDCIKLQGELRRVGVPRDKMFPHSVQVVHRRWSHVRHADRRYHWSLQLRVVDAIRELMRSAIHSWSSDIVFIRRCAFVAQIM